MSQVKMATKRRSRAAWPIMGLLLGVSLAVISWFLVTPLKNSGIMPRNLTRLLEGMPQLQGEIFIAAFIFIILLSLAVLFVAIFAPRKKIQVRDSDMLKERQDMIKDQKRKELYARRIAQENRRALREENQKKGQ